ncbi:hypothetical protein [Actomonas aquatica]|uniref:Uncharacterized protein n=1 Tax=Actomonas aquatica TaxID=2866162 RepID=A0ABZ1CD54_9BACT|nr:hypothetical protein [Opitutus sp. WL0086]WRQ89609.1 hypothetical protein K1X11_009325 [Opitutus sp. WL0086]
MSDDPKPDPLSKLLATWREQPSARPEFRAEVWQRIEREAAADRSFAVWLRQHGLGLSAMAAATVLMAGAGGVLTAQRLNERERAARLDAYVSSIDPHQRVDLEDSP